MIRIASQLTFCSPQQILRRAVVERDDDKLVTRIFGLDETRVETANTLFYDGVLSSGIISLNQHYHEFNSSLLETYQYVNVSGDNELSLLAPSAKPLILDFGTDNVSQINPILRQIAPSLSLFSIFDIIAACTYYPTVVLNGVPMLCVGKYSDLICWQNVDLIEKKITVETNLVVF